MLGLAMAIGLGIAGCAPIIQVHGYAPDEETLSTITVGQDDRATVARKIGRPTMNGVFTDDSWYYVTSTVKRYLYHAPEVVDRKVVAVRFDETGRVAAVKTYGLEDGRIIDLETQTTPTHGRELTILQQVFGNLGRLSGETLLENQ